MVTATGMETQMGRIATMLTSVKRTYRHCNISAIPTGS